MRERTVNSSIIGTDPISLRLYRSNDRKQSKVVSGAPDSGLLNTKLFKGGAEQNAKKVVKLLYSYILAIKSYSENIEEREIMK